MRSRCEALPAEVFAQVDDLALNQALARVMDVVGEINGYLERTAPWREAKAGHEERVATILYTACEALRLVSVLLQPVLPERMGELWRRLGWQPPRTLGTRCPGVGCGRGRSVVLGPPLFPTGGGFIGRYRQETGFFCRLYERSRAKSTYCVRVSCADHKSSRFPNARSRFCHTSLP